MLKAALVRAALPLARALYGGIGCVLCLHRVLPESARARLPGNRALEITPGDLRALLAWVRRRGLEPLSLDDIPTRLAAPRGAKFVAFTFDDGYRDNLKFALPIFREARVPFAVNVTTGFIDATEPAWWLALERLLLGRERIAFTHAGITRELPLRTDAERNDALASLGTAVRSLGPVRRNAFVRELCEPLGVDAWAITREAMMTWDELRALAADPLATIGAHTRGHHNLNGLTEPEARAELMDGKREIETQLDGEVRHLAYPFGGRNAVGAREFQLARDGGFATATTTRSANLFSRHAQNLHALPRLGVSGNYRAVDRLAELESGLRPALEHGGRRTITD